MNSPSNYLCQGGYVLAHVCLLAIVYKNHLALGHIESKRNVVYDEKKKIKNIPQVCGREYSKIIWHWTILNKRSFICSR